MSSYETKAFTFTAGDTAHTFANICGWVTIWSPSFGIWFELDAAIDGDSFLVPVDTMFSFSLPVLDLHIKGNGGGGTAYILGIYQTIGIADRAAYSNIGGIDV